MVARRRVNNVRWRECPSSKAASAAMERKCAIQAAFCVFENAPTDCGKNSGLVEKALGLA
jgi:hypothetical protein